MLFNSVANYYITHGLAVPETTYKILKSAKMYIHTDDPNFIDVHPAGYLELPGLGKCTIESYACMDIEPTIYIFNQDYSFISCIRLYENRYALNSRNMLNEEQVKIFNYWLNDNQWGQLVSYWKWNNIFTDILIDKRPDYSIILPADNYSIEDHTDKYEYKCEFTAMYEYINRYDIYIEESKIIEEKQKKKMKKKVKKLNKIIAMEEKARKIKKKRKKRKKK